MYTKWINYLFVLDAIIIINHSRPWADGTALTTPDPTMWTPDSPAVAARLEKSTTIKPMFYWVPLNGVLETPRAARRATVAQTWLPCT